jgi:hypothetical protein
VPPRTTSRSITSLPSGDPCERDAGGDHADVTERLREVAAELIRGRIDLLGQQPERARPGAQGRVELRGFLDPALMRKVLGEPEAAEHKGAFVAGDPVRQEILQALRKLLDGQAESSAQNGTSTKSSSQ